MTAFYFYSNQFTVINCGLILTVKIVVYYLFYIGGVMKLNDLIKEITLTPILKKDISGSFRILKTSAILNGSINEKYLERGSFESNKDVEKYILKKGDLVFQAKGNRFESIVIEKDYKNLVSSQIFFNLRVDPTIVDPGFLNWYLNSRLARAYFEKNSSGSVVKSVSKKVLLELNIKLPGDLEEQQNMVELVTKFDIEKKKTLEYLNKKRLLVNERIISSLMREA